MLRSTGLALLVAAAAPALGPALASSPAAWVAEAKAATAACIARSALKHASVRPGRVQFSDVLGVDAMLVTGTWVPKAMKGRTTTMLCLYHRDSRTAEIAEAPRWSSR